VIKNPDFRRFFMALILELCGASPGNQNGQSTT